MGDEILGTLTGGAVEQLVGLLGAVAEPEQALARDRPRVSRARDRDRLLGQRRADLLAQLDDDPLGRPLADPRDGLEARRVARRQRRQQLARAAAGEHGERDLGPDRLHAEQHQEQLAFLLGGESVQGERVVADDQVGVQRDLEPAAGTCRSVSADTARR